MAHDNREIAQEEAADFLSKDIWEFVKENKDKYGWNEMYIVKISKLDINESKIVGKPVVKTHLSAFEAKEGVLEKIRNAIGVMGSFCLYVKCRPKEIKHVWNLPFEKRGGLIIPDGRASSLVMDSVAQLDKGKASRLDPGNYASLGING